MPPAQQAARLTDPVTHGWGMVGLVGGALLGAALLIGGVITGGALVAVVVIAGMALAGHQLAKGIERAFGIPGPPGGALAPGAANVRINQLPAQRVMLDGAVGCSGLPMNHWPMPVSAIAEGSKTVRINNLQAARVTSRLVCGAQVQKGSQNVYIGGATEQVLPIDDLESELVAGLGIALIGAALIGGALIVGAAFAAGGIFAALGAGLTFAVQLGLGFAAFELVGQVGDAIGPGWRDIFQGVFGIGAIFAGAAKLRSIEDRPYSAEPVDSVTGEVCTTSVDIALPASLELELKRAYASGLDYSGCFGPKWCSTWGQYVIAGGGTAVYCTADGRSIAFDLNGSDWVRNDRVNKIRLRQTQAGFEVRDENLRTLKFSLEIERRYLLTSIEDRNGNSISLHHDVSGALREVVHSGGYRLAVEGTSTQIRRVSLVTGGGVTELVRYEYDRGGRLAAVINGSGLPFRYEYDSEARIVRWQDRTRTWYSYRYDSDGRCIEAFGPERMYHYRFEYDTGIRTNLITDSFGGAARFTYNHLLQVVERVDPRGGFTRTRWDQCSNKLEETDPSGRTTSYTYDADGNLLNATDPLGRTTRVAYTELGLPGELTDAAGRRWLRAYDEAGNVVEAGLAGKPAWKYERDQRGNVVRITDPIGGAREFQYDLRGLLIWHTDWEQNATRLARDEQGRVVIRVDALGNRTEFRYDALGKLAETVLPTGAHLRWEYDAEGNLLRRVDPNGRSYSYEYTYFDLLSQVRKPSGGSLRLKYDTEGRISTVENELGEEYRYEYNATGQVTSEQDFSGRTLRFEYDDSGLCIKRINGLGQEITLERDQGGQIARKISPDDEVLFDYDPLGWITRAKNTAVDVRLERDEFGRVIREFQNDRVVESEYDGRGIRTVRRTGSGHEVRYDSDANGMLIGLGLPAGHFEITRDALGRETQRQARGGFILRQEYDPLDQLLSQWAGPIAGSPDPLVERRYRYDVNGNPVELWDRRWGGESFEYEDCDRIVAARRERGASEVFTYDAAGNITSTLVQFSSPPPAETQIKIGMQTRFYSKGGRLVQVGGARYTFDDDGRVVEKREGAKRWQYTWDAEGRLRNLRTPNGERWAYEYDPFGRRTHKVGPRSATIYLWDGAVLAEEITESGDPSSWVYEPGTFRPLAKQERGKAYACITDQVGTPRELLTTSGELAWSARFETWGSKAVPTPARTDCMIRFQGQWLDVESDLRYNFHRYYDPETEQYLSPDPIGLLGGTRSYGYVHNPLSWVDPMGLVGCATELRNAPGTATGGQNLPKVTGRWLRGSQGNVGVMPGQISDRLRGQNFKDFGEFRESFWKAVGADPDLSAQFSRSNRALMRAGRSPIAVEGQSYGGQSSYVLHHIEPIQHGGGVYDLNNILVATPRYHAEVLDPSYHFGGGG